MNTLPSWAFDVLRDPADGSRLHRDGACLLNDHGLPVARVDRGILRFDVPAPDPSVVVYRANGGAHFYERSNTPFAMSTLDTPVYHDILGDVRPPSRTDLVVDVGGGDGRNAVPWLRWGYERLVVVDAVPDALIRLRQRLNDEAPEWLERCLLIEADARHLPLVDGVAATVQAIEALEYLNEDFALGLSEVARLLSPGGRALVACKNWEAGLIIRLLYFGIEGLLDSFKDEGQSMYDKTSGGLIRSHLFTNDDIRNAMVAQGFEIIAHHGTPLLSAIIGQLHGCGRFGLEDESQIAELHNVLRHLARAGVFFRSHVLIGRRL